MIAVFPVSNSLHRLQTTNLVTTCKNDYKQHSENVKVNEKTFIDTLPIKMLIGAHLDFPVLRGLDGHHAGVDGAALHLAGGRVHGGHVHHAGAAHALATHGLCARQLLVLAQKVGQRRGRRDITRHTAITEIPLQN